MIDYDILIEYIWSWNNFIISGFRLKFQFSLELKRNAFSTRFSVAYGICFWLPFLDAISIKLGGRKWGAKGGANWQKSNQLFWCSALGAKSSPSSPATRKQSRGNLVSKSFFFFSLLMSKLDSFFSSLYFSTTAPNHGELDDWHSLWISFKKVSFYNIFKHFCSFTFWTTWLKMSWPARYLYLFTLYVNVNKTVWTLNLFQLQWSGEGFCMTISTKSSSGATRISCLLEVTRK